MTIYELADQWQATFEHADGLMHNLQHAFEESEKEHGRNHVLSVHLYQAYENAKTARAKLARVEEALVNYIEEVT